MAEHMLEMAGALVRVRAGEVEVLTDPKVKWCPLRSGLYGHGVESRKTVESVLKRHMEELGMYGPHRVLELSDRPVSFGASEMIADAMRSGLVDAAVVVCEGAGTVVAARPEVVAALGAHMTGLVRTEPIEEIQVGLRERGCLLLDDRCTIDQVEGYKWALAAGYEKIVVTITGKRAFEAGEIRKLSSASACGQAGEEPVINLATGQAEDTSYRNVDDLFARIQGLPASLRDYITTDSGIFRITSVGSVHGVKRTVWCIVSFDGQKMRTLQWREDE